MSRAELRAWLNLGPADVPCWLALACCVAMFFVRDFALDAALACAAVFLASLACVFGVRHDPNVSRLTNAVKKASYPLLVLAVCAVVYVNFTLWNRLPPPRPSPGSGPPAKSPR